MRAVPLAVARPLVGILDLFGQWLALSPFRTEASTQDFHHRIAREVAKTLEDFVSILASESDSYQKRKDVRRDIVRDGVGRPELQKNSMFRQGLFHLVQRRHDDRVG